MSNNCVDLIKNNKISNSYVDLIKNNKMSNNCVDLIDNAQTALIECSRTKNIKFRVVFRPCKHARK